MAMAYVVTWDHTTVPPSSHRVVIVPETPYLLSIVSCLCDKDPAKIVKAQFVGSEHSPMAPIVDGKWIKDDLKKMLKEHKFKKCPVLAGASKNEGSAFLLYSNPEVFTIDGFSMNQDQLKATITSLFSYHLDYPEVKVSNIDSILLKLNAILKITIIYLQLLLEMSLSQMIYYPF